jgi:mRNA-degrading endonuclease RelE of RelBE toxin-antitoxin system
MNDIAHRGCIDTVSSPVLAPSWDSGYTLARMRFEIVLAPGAAVAYKRLKANIRAGVRDAIEMYLRHEPTKVSKSRIKRLRGLSRPQYRLRVGDIRVFYDVADREVAVLAIVTKTQAESWLAREGIPNENGGAGEG